MVDTGNCPYNDDFCYCCMGDEDDFNDSYCDPSDLCCYDDDFFMEGIEVDHSFCYGVWVETMECVENAPPDGDFRSRSRMPHGGTGLKGRERGDHRVSEHRSKHLAKKKVGRGLKMKKDFEGDLWLVPDYVHNDDTSNGYDPNNMVVDEKMWNNSNGKKVQSPKGKKFKKDYSMKLEVVEHKAPKVDCTKQTRGDKVVRSSKVELEAPK